MDRIALVLIVALSTVVPAALVAFGEPPESSRADGAPPPGVARAAAGVPDPVRAARARMYLSAARALLADPEMQARGCRLLRHAERAGAARARRLHRAHCAE